MRAREADRSTGHTEAKRIAEEERALNPLARAKNNGGGRKAGCVGERQQAHGGMYLHERAW